jgi:ADP-ribosylglycohydrolase
MNSSQDKILGSWFGMAIGDALGMAVKGLKPETVKQCFGSMDDFKDVRQFIGKGVKRYRMKGLYGITTQRALAVVDIILKTKKAQSGAISDLLQKLATNGPESYFGSFRQAEAGFFHAVESFPGKEPLLPADQNHAGGSYPPLAIPIALFHQRESPEMIRQCLETGLLLSRNPMEIIGTALVGSLTTHFLALEPDADGEVLAPEISRQILEDAVSACERAEDILKERFPEIDLAGDEKVFQAMRLTVAGTLERWDEEPASLFGWIAENASSYGKNKITHPAQGHVLTLIPLALVLVLKESKEFAGVLTRAANMGKESARLGALVGAWAGALYGFDVIPRHFKSGLVNAKEIKSRGEALFQRRAGKGLKGLVEMELALTLKEFEEAKRVTPKKAQKETGRISSRFDFDEEEFEETAIPKKEDAAKWRKFQKDKTKMKRDRRRNLNVGFEPDEADED